MRDFMNQKLFLTTGRLVQKQDLGIVSPRGRLLIASCRSGSYIAQKAVGRYKELSSEGGTEENILYLADIDFQFSDTETCVRLNRDVSGCDVFLFQGLFDPNSGRSVDQNYLAFLIAVRTFREWGANHVVGVIPYLTYARQDKPTRFTREPTTAELMADLSTASGIERLVTWDPHTGRIRGFYGNIPVDILDALPLFLKEFEHFRGQEDVIVVAPDAGAAKFVTYFGRELDLQCAIASKYRPRPEKAVITEIIGDLAGKTTAIVLDDMINTGGTVHALVKQLVEERGIQEVYIGVSHNLCMEVAQERLKELHADYYLRYVVVTNSIPQTDAVKALPFVSVRNLADVLSRVINRIHYNRSVSELFDRQTE